MERAPSWCQTWTWSYPRCGQSLYEKAGQEGDHWDWYKEEDEKAGIGWNSLSYLPVTADHDIVTVAVSDPQNISGHTVARAGQRELLDGAFKSVTVNTL